MKKALNLYIDDEISSRMKERYPDQVSNLTELFFIKILKKKEGGLIPHT